MNDEMIRGMASPDPTPTINANAMRDSQVTFGTYRANIKVPMPSGMSSDQSPCFTIGS